MLNTFTISELKTAPTRIIDAARESAVKIEKHGKPVAFVVSPLDYARLEALAERAWEQELEARIQDADFLSPAESLAFIKNHKAI